MKKRKNVKRSRKPATPPDPPPRTYSKFELEIHAARQAEKAVDDRVVQDFMNNARALQRMPGLSPTQPTSNTVANVLSLMRVLERHGY